MTNVPPNPDDELVPLIDDEPSSPQGYVGKPWRILIVDDDQEVHSSTLFALADQRILGRPLEFLHAYTAEDARRILAVEDDIAVAFLDVVMEVEDAGLKLVRVIRQELGLAEIRIILRTGQPGYAPELEAIRDYDLNDYRTKSELTRTRLVTSLTTALRSYEQIRTIAYSRRGLEKIVHASADLFEKRALESLSEGVLTQIAGLLGFSANGVVCAQRGYPMDGSDQEQFYVVGAVGRYAEAINRPLKALADARIEQAIRQCIETQTNLYAADYTVLYLKNPGGTEEAIFLDSNKPVELIDRQLLEVFASNISVGFSNAYMFHRLNYLAFYDALTDLPNRQMLLELTQTKWRVRRSPYVVFLVDIDHFSDINGVVGTSQGDQILRAVAGRLRVRLPHAVQLGRFGGDVMCVIGDPEELTAQTILNLFTQPFELLGYTLPITVTIGECEGSPAQDAQDIFKNAGLALTQAKRIARGNCVNFTEQMAEASRQRLVLHQDLRRAIKENHLELYYQPQLALDSGRVIGAEALLRWQREDGQRISPAVFIPLAEQTGMIGEIGEWVLKEACRQVAEWSAAGLDNLHMAINVSAHQVKQGACAPALQWAIRHYGLKPELIQVEITESMLLEDITAAIGCLSCFKNLGVKIALDDFGTGFSSLSYLHRLPIDCLKVDRAFVLEVGRESHGERIAEMIVALARVLKLKTVAEGIETEAQAEAARKWGCDVAQGFLYAPAMRPDEFAVWVAERHARLGLGPHSG